MAFNASEIYVKQIEGKESVWLVEPAIIGKDIVVLTQDTAIWKKGDGLLTYSELPVIFDSYQFEIVYELKDIFDDYGISTRTLIAYVDDDKTLSRTIVTEEDLLNIEYLIQGNEEKNLILDPIIVGPSKKRYGTEITLKAEHVWSCFNDKGDRIEYTWVLPDGTVKYGQEITYLIPNSASLVGQHLIFTCKAKSFLGFESKVVDYRVQIVENDSPLLNNIECIENPDVTYNYNF